VAVPERDQVRGAPGSCGASSYCYRSFFLALARCPVSFPPRKHLVHQMPIGHKVQIALRGAPCATFESEADSYGESAGAHDIRRQAAGHLAGGPRLYTRCGVESDEGDHRPKRGRLATTLFHYRLTLRRLYKVRGPCAQVCKANTTNSKTRCRALFGMRVRT
jgi:hypothetical protein